MRAIVLDRPGAFRVAEVPGPAPRPAEIVVRVECCGILAIGDTVDGAFAEYVAVPAVSAYRLPPHLDGQCGAMAEPLSCAVSPFRSYNDELTIVGSMAVLRSFGAAVDLLSSGAVDPRALLAEPLPLAGFGTAADRVRAGQGIKWHIRP